VAGGPAVFEATLRQHRLVAGKTGVVLVLAAAPGRASVVFCYYLGLLEASLFLPAIVSAIANEIRLDGGVMIAVHTSNFRRVRGRTVPSAIFDEVAFRAGTSSQAPRPSSILSTLTIFAFQPHPYARGFDPASERAPPHPPRKRARQVAFVGHMDRQLR
jgi:hypothetical protein